MAHPHLSVIIPTYNRTPLLLAAVQSVLAQSYGADEIIVADDGSAQPPRSLIEGLDPRVRFLQLPHRGRPAVTRNRALAVASGELVAFLDDDDLWRPDKLARQVALLDKDPALGFVYSDVERLQPDGSRSAPLLAPQQKRSGPLLSSLIEDCYLHPSTVIVRRRLLDAAGGFDETLKSAEDYDLWLRLAARAPGGCVPLPLVAIRHSHASISQRREIATYRAVIRALERLAGKAPLTVAQRLRLRRVLSRRYVHLSILLGARRRRLAASPLRRALCLDPFQKRGWRYLLHLLAPSP